MEKNNQDVKVVEVEAKKETAENEFLIKLKKAYQFEGETITEVDLSGLEDLTAADMIKANKVLNASGNVTVLPETNLEYCLVIAASASGKPVEFFKALAPRDAIQVKNKVTGFLFGEE